MSKFIERGKVHDESTTTDKRLERVTKLEIVRASENSAEIVGIRGYTLSFSKAHEMTSRQNNSNERFRKYFRVITSCILEVGVEIKATKN
jgi:hypothetical protein